MTELDKLPNKLQERWELAERRCSEVLDLDSDPPVRYTAIYARTAQTELEELKKLVLEELASAKEKERQKIIDLLTSGKGRETGIWHYELNDHSEMEASYTGDYLSLKEVMNQLTNPKESNQ